MNYLYAKLNKEAEKLKYKGVNTATVNMNVDNKNYTISADVKNVHDSRIPELTGEEGFCVPFVNEVGTAFQIGSLPSECLDNGSVTTEKIANGAVTADKLAFHLYQHVIYLSKYRLRFYLFNSTSKPYTKIGELPDFASIPASGSYADSGQTGENNIITAVSQQNEMLTVEGVTTNSGQYIIAMEQPTTSIVDTVTQLI